MAEPFEDPDRFEESGCNTHTVPGGELAVRPFAIAHTRGAVIRMPSGDGDAEDCVHQISSGVSGGRLSDSGDLSRVAGRPPRARLTPGPPRGDVLLNGLDLEGDIRPDLLPKIRNKLRLELTKIDTRIGPDLDSFATVRQVEELSRIVRDHFGEVHRLARQNHEAAMAALRETPWQKLLRFIARMTWPLTRRSS